MFIALSGAIAAAFCYGLATILEAIAVKRLTSLPSSVTIVRRVRAGYLYGIGLLVDGLGFVLSAAALLSLPLFLVESVVASSVAVTAVLSVMILKQRLSRAEIIALIVLVFGLTGLGVTAKDGPAVHTTAVAAWCVLTAVIPLGLLAAFFIIRWNAARGVHGRSSGIALAIIAGLGFGMVGIVARLIPVHSQWSGYVLDPLVWAVVGYGLLAVVVYGFALDRLATTTAASLCFAVETIVPSAVGLALLGDEIRAGLWPVAAVGFLVTLGACIALSARSEVEI